MYPYQLTGGPGIGLFPSEFECTVRNGTAANRVAGSVMMTDVMGAVYSVTSPAVNWDDASGNGKYGKDNSRYATVVDLTLGTTGDDYFADFCVLLEDIPAGEKGMAAFQSDAVLAFIRATAGAGNECDAGDPLIPLIGGTGTNGLGRANSATAAVAGSAPIIGRQIDSTQVAAGSGPFLRYVQFCGLAGGFGSLAVT